MKEKFKIGWLFFLAGIVLGIGLLYTYNQYINPSKKKFITKGDKRGLYYYDGADTLTFETVSARKPDPTSLTAINDYHRYYMNSILTNNEKTEYVNFQVADIADYHNNLRSVGVNPIGYRVKFIKYDHAPRIGLSDRPEYINKISVALIALLNNPNSKQPPIEYGGSPATATQPDTRPRNLGTIHPPD